MFCCLYITVEIYPQKGNHTSQFSILNSQFSTSLNGKKHDTGLSDTGISASGSPRRRCRLDIVLKWQHLMAHRRRSARFRHRLMGADTSEIEGGCLPRQRRRSAQRREAFYGERLPPRRAPRAPRLRRCAPLPVEVRNRSVVHDRDTEGLQRNC